MYAAAVTKIAGEPVLPFSDTIQPLMIAPLAGIAVLTCAMLATAGADVVALFPFLAVRTSPFAMGLPSYSSYLSSPRGHPRGVPAIRSPSFGASCQRSPRSRRSRCSVLLAEHLQRSRFSGGRPGGTCSRSWWPAQHRVCSMRMESSGGAPDFARVTFRLHRSWERHGSASEGRPIRPRFGPRPNR
jgi:hypothetical protein